MPNVIAITPAATATRIRFAAVVVPSKRGSRDSGRVRRARRTVLSFIAAVLFVNIAVSIVMDTVAPSLKDGEYMARRERILARTAANPDRPLAVVLGSSRTDFGIRPLAEDRGPLVCNASLVGAGPIMELLALRRLLHDGIAPQSLIVEYWPPFLRGLDYSEFLRLDPHRYFPGDEPFIRDYAPNPEVVLGLMREYRRTPIWSDRHQLINHVLPGWLPYDKRIDGNWSRVDAAGWLPGYASIPPEVRVQQLRQNAQHYQPLLADYSVGQAAERALREILATCRERGIAVTLLWMPESSELRAWYSPAALAKSQAFLAMLQHEYGVPAIVARDWMPNECFSDGLHLTTDAAAAFTHRLMSEIAK